MSTDREFFKEKSQTYLTQNEEKVLFWIEKKTEVGPQKKILLRICDATNFGLNIHGFYVNSGQFYTTLWKTALKMFIPHVIEIYGSANPLPYLVYALMDLDEDTRSGFLQKVRQLSISQTDVQMEELTALLNFLPNLMIFSMLKMNLFRPELTKLMNALERCALQAIKFTPDPLTLQSVADANLQLQIVHFCNGEGATISELSKLLSIKFPFTKLLYIQESAFEESVPDDSDNTADNPFNSDDQSNDYLNDSYKILDESRRIFPVLQTLIYDWNIVEPFTETSIKTVSKLIEWLKVGSLQRIAFPIYAPSSQILAKVTKIRDQFTSEKNLDCRLFRYFTQKSSASNPDFDNHQPPNFALLLITKDETELENPDSITHRIHNIFVQHTQTIIDDLSLLLYILYGDSDAYKQFYATNANIMTLNFGGFNNELVDEKYQQAR